MGMLVRGICPVTIAQILKRCLMSGLMCAGGSRDPRRDASCRVCYDCDTKHRPEDIGYAVRA